MKNRLFISLLLIIVAVGAVLRLINLSSFPPALNWDEVSHGYNVYSILKTGADEWGRAFPILNFRAYGDYPLPLNLYLTIPFIFFLGLTEFSIRFPHAILGILTIISTYFLAWGLTKNKYIGLISSFLVAISPWTLFTSRVVFQSNLSIFLLVTFMALFVHRDKKKCFFPLSLILLFLTLFSYHSTRIFSPLLLIGLTLLFKKEFANKLAIVISVIFFVVTAVVFVNPESRARSKWVFLVNESAVNKIEGKRNTSTLPFAIKRLIYNRPTYFAVEFTKNYLEYFSPKYLFIKGGTQYQFSVPNQGLEYLINLPFFYIGLVLLLIRLIKEKDNNTKLIFLWLILSPIAASITTEKFAVLRSSTMIPLVEIITAVGLIYVLSLVKTKKKLFVSLYIILIAIFAVKYLSIYFGSYTKDYSWSWQYGYKEAVNYVKENYNKYDKIIVTKKYGEPHEFFLFFMKYDPLIYRTDPNLIRFFQSDWYWVDRFDKFYFVNDWQVKDMKLESGGKIDCSHFKCLLISSPDNGPGGWLNIYRINFLDGKPAFEMYGN
jgi:4-amino-4-deoxy-L-arabinose transferase-like glycosyltransferase